MDEAVDVVHRERPAADVSGNRLRRSSWGGGAFDSLALIDVVLTVERRWTPASATALIREDALTSAESVIA